MSLSWSPVSVFLLSGTCLPHSESHAVLPGKIETAFAKHHWDCQHALCSCFDLYSPCSAASYCSVWGALSRPSRPSRPSRSPSGLKQLR